MKPHCLVGGLCLTLAAFGLKAAPGVPRLAIVPEHPAAVAAVDLLTAELSHAQGVALVERSEINRLYQEQQLSAANKDYLKLGEVLGADGLLVFDAVTEDKNQVLQLKIIAVKPGVVLTSERFSFSLASTPEWAAGFSRHLAPLLPKISVLQRDAIPVSVIGLRSAVQSEEGRELERQLTLLLIERLSRQPEVFVLERRRMQTLAEEKELKGMDDSAFWAGSFLLEGILDRDGYSPEKLTINARLVPPQGGAPQNLDVTCSRTNLAMAVAQLAEHVLAALKLKPSAVPWNSGDEAEPFFTNASWAYRWGLLSEAQAASESAWALGKRGESLARLRARAYADDVWTIHPSIGNIEIPGLPDATRLKPLLRALELFCNDSLSVSTNPGRLDGQWYLNGLRLFRESAAMLDGFYHWAELTATYQAQVADTRSWTRQLLRLLETHPAMERQVLKTRRLSGGAEAIEAYSLLQELKMYDLVKWNEGGLLFDRPEDSLPMYRSMLEKGYAPLNLPRLIGWSWNQRKAVPGITRAFIDELCASTNPATRLPGLALAVIKTPFYPELEFHQKEAALVSALWEYRDWVISSVEHAQALVSAEQILRDKYSDSDVNRYFTREPFAGTRFRLEQEFLLRSTNFDNERFQIIFPLSYRLMPSAQARDIALAMEPLAKDRIVRAMCNDFRAKGGLTVPTNAPPSLPALPPEEPLTARFISWKVARPPWLPSSRLHFERLVLRNGRIWSLAGFLPKDEMHFALRAPTLCIAVDPQTGSCQEIPFPESMGRPDDNLEATSDALYVSVQDHIARYRFATSTWDTVQLPLEGGAQLLAVGDRVYLANATTILELNPATQGTRVLASARRQPSLNDLDVLLNSSPHLYARSDGNLGILVSDHLFSWSLPSQILNAISVVPPGVGRTFKTPFFSPDAVLFRTEDFMRKTQLIAFWNNEPGMELLLEAMHSGPGPQPQPGAKTNAVVKPRWEWPAGFALDVSCILGEGTNLWVLSPRKVWNPMGISFEKPVNFSDSRQATLFKFEANSLKPLSVPIAFEPASIEPFDPFHGGYSFLSFRAYGASEYPFWLQTPAGLLFSAPTLGGHWLIPKAALDSRLGTLRAKL